MPDERFVPPFRSEEEMLAWITRPGVRPDWDDKVPLPDGAVVAYIDARGDRLWMRSSWSKRVGTEEVNGLVTMLTAVRFEPVRPHP